MSVKIRLASKDEIGLLIKWREIVLREVFALGERADLSGILAQNEAYYREAIASGAHIACFALDEEGREIGCGGVCFQRELPSPDNPNGQNAFLMNIYASPSFRGQGIGRAVVEFLVERAKERGAGKIYLESTIEAAKLYREIGFEDSLGYMKLIQI